MILSKEDLMEDKKIYLDDCEYELVKAVKEHKCEKCKGTLKPGKFYVLRLITVSAWFRRERYHIGCALGKMDYIIKRLRENIKKVEDYKKEMKKWIT